MSMELNGRLILLIICGGIAAYKSLELIRRLKERGARVRVVLTRAGSQFVTPLSAATLSGEAVHQELFDLTSELDIGHIELGRQADLIVVAPASADMLARMAHGLADDLASATLLAAGKPVLLAPAMNTRMWENAATRRNLKRLADDGHLFVGPNEGPLAEGESGMGRMAEPHEILRAIETALAGRVTGSGSRSGPLAGRRILVTSGPTHEPIDPVRYIANRSSGKQGHAVAAALAALGADVVLVSGPVAVADPAGVTVHPVMTARDMLAACEAALPVDAAVCAAAVADWRSDDAAQAKIKKGARGAPNLVLVENPDILASLARRADDRPVLVVGFAAETENLLANATAKRLRKGCDWIVANDVSPGTGVMGGEENTVHLITPDGSEAWPTMSKHAVATRLAERIAAHLAQGAQAQGLPAQVAE